MDITTDKIIFLVINLPLMILCLTAKNKSIKDFSFFGILFVLSFVFQSSSYTVSMLVIFSLYILELFIGQKSHDIKKKKTKVLINLLFLFSIISMLFTFFIKNYSSNLNTLSNSNSSYVFMCLYLLIIFFVTRRQN